MLVNGMKIIQNPKFRRALEDMGIFIVTSSVFSFLGYVWARTGGHYLIMKNMHRVYTEGGPEELTAFLLDEGIAKTDGHAKQLVKEYELKHKVIN